MGGVIHGPTELRAALLGDRSSSSLFGARSVWAGAAVPERKNVRNRPDHVNFDSPRGTNVSDFRMTALDTAPPITDLEKLIVRDHIRDYQQPNDPPFATMLGVDQ